MSRFIDDIQTRLADIRAEGLWKTEREITSPQRGRISVGGREVINLCANNYLGLADHPDLIRAAQLALDEHGYGMASVRFICGTQDLHRELERQLASYLGHDDSILFAACFDANGALFDPLLGEGDAIISDALNHASIIDGIRLCKAQRLRYANNDLAELESCLQRSSGARYRLIATDGVFSMDGSIADLRGIVELADRHDAIVMVDDSHAVGVLGANGRGTQEHCDVMGRVDIITGTLGKALGGASGGYVSARREVVEWLRQRSRPYLFSNSLAPIITATSISVLDLIQRDHGPRDALRRNTRLFRDRITALGFEVLGGEHPIVPIMLRDVRIAQEFARRLTDRGVYVTAFSFPVVPHGLERIRTQMSAAHSVDHVEFAISACAAVGRELDVIPEE